MPCNTVSPRRLRALVPLALSVALIVPLATRSRAATYTYTVTGGFSAWSSGVNWNVTPVSGSATTLVFTGSLGTATVNISQNDLGTFTLSSLLITATGGATDSSSIAITGDPLQFVSNSGTSPSVMTVLTGSTLPAVLIATRLVLADSLTVSLSPAAAITTISGTISGPGALTKTGPGTLALGTGTGNGFTNTYSGDTRIEQGAILLGKPKSLAGSTVDMRTGDTGSLNFGLNDTTFDLGGLKGTRAIDNAGNTLAIGGNGQSTTYAGSLSGTGGLVKTGAGGLVLAGTSTFSGPTTVESGSLILDGRLANSNVSVGSGGLFGGTGSIAGDLTVAGTLSPGSTPGGIGALTVSGSVTLEATATTLFGVTGSSTFDEIVGTGGAFTNGGDLVLSIDLSGTLANGTTFDLIHGFAAPHLGGFDTASLFATGAYAGLNGTSLVNTTFYGTNVWASDWVNSDVNGRNGQRFLFDQSTGTLELVPEPGTWTLAAVAAATIGLTRWHRRRRAGRPA